MRKAIVVKRMECKTGDGKGTVHTGAGVCTREHHFLDRLDVEDLEVFNALRRLDGDGVRERDLRERREVVDGPGDRSDVLEF